MGTGMGMDSLHRGAKKRLRPSLIETSDTRLLVVQQRSHDGVDEMRWPSPSLLTFDACLQGNHHLCWSLTRLNSSDLNAYDDRHHRSYKDTIIAGYDQPHLWHGPHRP
ncbi:hypothetical protein CF319_g4497 [Tilletia indica]|nr:hypothetical protein CF319_g4497 [Tilletia indica]